MQLGKYHEFDLLTFLKKASTSHPIQNSLLSYNDKTFIWNECILNDVKFQHQNIAQRGMRLLDYFLK